MLIRVTQTYDQEHCNQLQIIYNSFKLKGKSPRFARLKSSEIFNAFEREVYKANHIGSSTI